jgi:hypothetical protein
MAREVAWAESASDDLAEIAGESCAVLSPAPDHISDEEVQAYLVHLLRERPVSSRMCNVVVNGLRVFHHTTLKRVRTTLRQHSFATHLPTDGCDIRTVVRRWCTHTCCGEGEWGCGVLRTRWRRRAGGVWIGARNCRRRRVRRRPVIELTGAAGELGTCKRPWRGDPARSQRVIGAWLLLRAGSYADRRGGHAGLCDCAAGNPWRAGSI